MLLLFTSSFPVYSVRLGPYWSSIYVLFLLSSQSLSYIAVSKICVQYHLCFSVSPPWPITSIFILENHPSITHPTNDLVKTKLHNFNYIPNYKLLSFVHLFVYVPISVLFADMWKAGFLIFRRIKYT